MFARIITAGTFTRFPVLFRCSQPEWQGYIWGVENHELSSCTHSIAFLRSWWRKYFEQRTLQTRTYRRHLSDWARSLRRVTQAALVTTGGWIFNAEWSSISMMGTYMQNIRESGSSDWARERIGRYVLLCSSKVALWRETCARRTCRAHDWFFIHHFQRVCIIRLCPRSDALSAVEILETNKCIWVFAAERSCRNVCCTHPVGVETFQHGEKRKWNHLGVDIVTSLIIIIYTASVIGFCYKHSDSVARNLLSYGALLVNKWFGVTVNENCRRAELCSLAKDSYETIGSIETFMHIPK